MSDTERLEAAEWSLDEWSELLGDDVHYWMGNPFLDADLRASKVVWWLNRAAVLGVPASPKEQTDALPG